MKFCRHLLIGCSFPFLIGADTKSERVTTSAPVKDYAVSFFSDEGFPRVRVVGESADLADRQLIKLTGMNLILYTGAADREIETTLESPVALLEPSEELVGGPDSVNLRRSDLEVSGEDWSYDHRDRRIKIRRSARIIFKTPLEGFLE
ncbi:MAG: hypothetical protein SynsKO_15750 [Synoicihabitans sp.]